MTVMILCLPAFAGRTQNDYHFIQINSSNSGLSYDDCRTIFQDSRGYMWFGTYMGLNRYDGHRFAVYDRDDLCGISDFIHAIEEDDNGDLWIGTDDGLIVYDYDLDTFRFFDMESDEGTVVRNKVNCIRKDASGVIWFAANGQGLFSYDVKRGLLRNYFVKDGQQSLPTNIRSFEPDHHGGMWVALYYAGLYHCDSSMETLVPVSDSDGIRLESDNIEGIVVSPIENDVIYISSVRNGLCRINTKNGRKSRLVEIPAESLPSGLICHKDRTLWMPTNAGLYRYDIVDDTHQVLKADNRDPFSIVHDYVFAAYVDSDGGLWVSTKYNGINYSGTAQRNFRKYYSVEERLLEDYIISGFADDGKGTVWITTEQGGLLSYDCGKDRLKDEEISILKGIDLISPCVDGRYLWLGSMKGLYRYDTRTGSLKYYSSLSQTVALRDNRIGTMFLSDMGDLYVGTTLGLSRYDRERDRFESLDVFNGINVTDLEEDSSGMIWVSTYADGIFRYDPVNEKVDACYSAEAAGQYHLHTDKISSLLVDSKDRVWAVGLTYGFAIYDRGRKCFVSYDSRTYPNMGTDVYFNALEDNDGHIWLSSDRGLLEVDPVTMGMSQYTVNDGLLDNVMKRGTLKTLDGDMYFASRRGFVRFNPSKFSGGMRRQSNVYLSGLTIADRLVRPYDPESPLDRNIDLVDRISLKAGQNSFGFSFSLPYWGGEKMLLQCRLDGYDNEWCDISSDRSVYYYNVPAGKYRFSVRATTDGVNWDISHSPLDIEVAEKFWRSSSAMVLYLLMVGLVFLFIARFLHLRSKKKMQEREEKDRIEREKKLLDEKMSFFSDVIHEIKTPLTLMMTPLRTILNSGTVTDESMLNNLQVISESADYMGSLVKELLDYVSVEEHGYVLEIRNVDVVGALKKVCSNFSDIASQRDMTLDVESAVDRLVIGADSKALTKVFNNLVHNAVKYANSWIRIAVWTKGDQVIIRFCNDGMQIPPERREDIFKPFVKFNTGSQYAAQSFGIGLPMAKKLVELHGGSLILTDVPDYVEFVLSIPLNVKETVQDESENACDIDTGLPTILLVEDSAELSQYLRKELHSVTNVISVTSAEKGLKILENRAVDLILTDISLPGMSGVEFCRVLNKDRVLDRIPRIILSAISSVQTKIECLDAGAVMYIEKPFAMDYLKACINRVLKSEKASVDEIIDSAAALHTLRHLNVMDKDSDFVEKLDEVILKNISDDTFGSKQMEDALFMSRSTLARKIKELYGTTPNEYLKNKRLSVAAQMLRQKNVRINEVADAVGFRSPSYFAKCFKAVYGMLPAEYVNEMNK